jgi:hypothetical protein
MQERARFIAAGGMAIIFSAEIGDTRDELGIALGEACRRSLRKI